MSDTSQETAYQVLARKYRPETFADLVGQDALVKTLKNAFESDRIAHAFIMTGIRGTGKTTTARIIAKGLNCIGADGKGGPTVEPCGKCEQCISISEGRHVDVMEMDAASRTGVGDIREIIESVHYRAASARYKVYIIDEVHMLSNSAFNALLKTLEEPPEHVKFIFATTEIRKVPVTVLSRCQRFDLRRFEPEIMINFLRGIASKEGAKISDNALALITRAAEGSARDALSLLDQAIAHGSGAINADQVRAMLGLADRGRVLDLFDLVMKGDTEAALNELGSQYADGAEPLAIIRDLAEVTHWISVVKISSESLEDPTISPDERERGQHMAANLPMRVLSRMWQMLLKVLEELTVAHNAMMAAEMAIIRLTHVADMPTPDDLVRKLQNAPAQNISSSPNTKPGNGGGGATASLGITTTAVGQVALKQAEPNVDALARFANFEDVIQLIRKHRDMKLLFEVESYLRLADYSPGRIEFEPTENAPSSLASQLAARLQNWTGVRWGVTVVNTGGGATIEEKRQERRNDLHTQALAHPLVQSVISAFPGAEIKAVKAPEFEASANEDIAPLDPDDLDDDWDPIDPFEE